MKEPLLVSVSPHVRHPDSIQRIMWTVALALTPAAIAGIYFFGLQALWVVALSIVSAQITEILCLKARGEPWQDAFDGSAFVTGLLLAMIIPANVPWYCPVVGSAFAIAIAKQCFGGLGYNIWNPALAGRIFLQFAYPTAISLSAWPTPRSVGLAAHATAAETQASPLFKGAAEEAVTGWDKYLDLFLGLGVSGSLGETSKLMLLIGGVFLIACRYIDWRVPVFYIGTVFLLTAVLPAGTESPPWWQNDPLYHIMSGGLFIGAFYMATDMVTTPITRKGRIIFAIGCGVLTSVIRFYSGYPEGVAYSIFLMNTAVPLIDRWTKPAPFGMSTLKEQAETGT